MSEEKKQEEILNTINEGITALRDKQKVLEDAGTAKETQLAEQKEMVETIMAKVDELEVEQKKLLTVASGEKAVSEKHKALLNWFRTGEDGEVLQKSDGTEAKTLRLSDSTLGGYLASPEMDAGFLKEITEYSPIRTIAKVRTIGKNSYRIRKRTGIPNGGRSGETETRTATTGLTFGMEEIPTHEYYAFDDISRWNLEDSDYNLEVELNDAGGEAIGVLEGLDFVSGDGAKKPEGFMANADVGKVAGGDASVLKADGIKALYFAPKSAYTKNAKFVMNRATMLAASILKNAVDGTYLLQQLPNAPVWAIMGAPVIEAKDMPAIASDAFPIAFGDFGKAYLIVDRTGISYLRDPYTQAASGAIRFWMFKRTGGQVILAEAIKKLKIATSV